MAIASWLGLVTVMAPQKQQCMAVDTVIQAMDQRHNAPPPHKTVNKKYPTTAVGVASEKLMVSPCRPEKDGYFGSTYGDPATLQYAFAMESRMNADISEALFVVQEYVMDVTIASTFPAICSARDLSVSAAENSNGVTGFKFGQEYAAIRT